MALASNLAFTLILLISFLVVTFASTNVHIVYMGDRSQSHGQSEPQLLEDSHLDMLSSILG
ncbi:xylem serine proteinase 1, partial [Trifolium medium]|nr:xylem serine proteinase 1 [Trifolium medium]